MCGQAVKHMGQRIEFEFNYNKFIHVSAVLTECQCKVLTDFSHKSANLHIFYKVYLQCIEPFLNHPVFNSFLCTLLHELMWIIRSRVSFSLHFEQTKIHIFLFYTLQDSEIRTCVLNSYNALK